MVLQLGVVGVNVAYGNIPFADGSNDGGITNQWGDGDKSQDLRFILFYKMCFYMG